VAWESGGGYSWSCPGFGEDPNVKVGPEKIHVK